MQIVTQAQRMKVKRRAHQIQRRATLHAALFLSWKNRKQEGMRMGSGKEGEQQKGKWCLPCTQRFCRLPDARFYRVELILLFSLETPCSNLFPVYDSVSSAAGRAVWAGGPPTRAPLSFLKEDHCTVTWHCSSFPEMHLKSKLFCVD